MSAARSVLSPFLFTRILTGLVALAAVTLFALPARCPDLCHRSTNPLLDAATRWDAGAYIDIAQNGYGAVPANSAYFPLYPFLMHVLATVFGGSGDAHVIAGVLISNLALLAALAYLAGLVALDHGAAAASRAAIYLLVFPTSVFLAAVYPESLLLALSIGAIYHARREQWLAAGALAALASLTRPFIGAAVGIPLAIEAYRRSGPRAALAAATPAAAALAGWLVALWQITGDPKAVLTAEANWGVGPSLPFEAFTDLFDPNVYGFPYFVLGSTLFVGALVLLSWRFLRPSLAAYATVVFLISVATGSLTSSPRYYLSVFPAFVVLALIARGWPGRAYLAVASTIAIVFTAMYALWYWVA